LKEYLYRIVGLIAKIHEKLMSINDAKGYGFTDKQLHFFVIGAIGMLGIFVIYPLFKWLADKGHVMIIAWLYVLTVLIVITFAIEIGQKITNTGIMEFADIVSGLTGFFVFFLIFAMIRGVFHLFVDFVKGEKE